MLKISASASSSNARNFFPFLCFGLTLCWFRGAGEREMPLPLEIRRWPLSLERNAWFCPGLGLLRLEAEDAREVEAVTFATSDGGWLDITSSDLTQVGNEHRWTVPCRPRRAVFVDNVIMWSVLDLRRLISGHPVRESGETNRRRRRMNTRDNLPVLSPVLHQARGEPPRGTVRAVPPRTSCHDSTTGPLLLNFSPNLLLWLVR